MFSKHVLAIYIFFSENKNNKKQIKWIEIRMFKLLFYVCKFLNFEEDKKIYTYIFSFESLHGIDFKLFVYLNIILHQFYVTDLNKLKSAKDR